jgi:outer membrane murein-binding lipoprotein Lpp
MSTVFGTSTSSKTDELLSDMITRLQAIEAKQDRMGEQLKGLDPLREKVASLEAVTTEIGATQETIARAVERIDRAQLTLHNKVNRLEIEQRAAHAGRRPSGGGSLNYADGDTMPISHKLEFPTFDGTGDLLVWLNRCARFFQVCSTPDHKKVTLAVFYLTDAAQLWFRRLELNDD